MRMRNKKALVANRCQKSVKDRSNFLPMHVPHDNGTSIAKDLPCQTNGFCCLQLAPTRYLAASWLTWSQRPLGCDGATCSLRCVGPQTPQTRRYYVNNCSGKRPQTVCVCVRVCVRSIGRKSRDLDALGSREVMVVMKSW